MLDINGNDLREGDVARLLCEIVSIEPRGIAVRIMNSDIVLYVGTKRDEVLGGEVADSELTKFETVESSAKSSPAFE